MKFTVEKDLSGKTNKDGRTPAPAPPPEVPQPETGLQENLA
jgi:hypothetical protein